MPQSLKGWTNRASIGWSLLMPDRKYRNEDWLRKKYVDEKLSMSEIADICGCYPSTLQRWLSKFNIETRGFGESKYHDNLEGENNPFYGKTHSKETKKKLSENMKKAWEEGDIREKREKWLKTEEAKKIAIENLPDDNKGENNGNWKGGVREKYYDGTYGWTWSKIRQIVLKRDNYSCRRCGMTNEEHTDKYGQGLQVHHKVEYPICREHKTDNLISLCVVCHNKIHGG